ncbi:arrestin domain-containing protein 2-like isoform X2 [Wyeomyia smithii]|nr:arrestin domain-containing protein 2-like isoform X2 [Wyeomyia smithii]
MNYTTYIVGSSDGENFALPAGTHLYNFSCILPSNLATSMEAKRGHIRYTLKVIVDRAWMLNKSYKMGFTVLQPLNLNFLSNVRFPIEMHITKAFCCWPCTTGPLHISAQLPISGYVPGQTIAVTIVVDNQSRRKLIKIISRFVQHIAYISCSPHRKIKEESLEMAQADSAANNKPGESRYEHHLFIPPLPPTNSTCEVLQVTYTVEVKATTNCGKNPVVKLPIILGTIPLSSCAVPRLNETTPPVGQQPKATTSSELSEFTTNHSEELPPPTYEEAMNATHINIQDDGESNEMGCKDFSPRYLIYRFPQGASVPPVDDMTRQWKSA